ncbi:hypothetical protein A9Q89_12620 [Gammaproteobacteria bacterium 53_120_T64]|nr:hypothetical protein A9Q89_12620 [Gammaproteobacteria bacterium 53_120_T64]
MSTFLTNSNIIAQRFGPILGRFLLAALFIPAGVNKIIGFSTVAGYMASKGLPMVDTLLVLTIIIELGGGLMILLGWHARLASLCIALFLIPVTIIFHPYWDIADAQEMMTQQHMFMKNMAIIGGLLCMTGLGSGKFSLKAAKFS